MNKEKLHSTKDNCTDHGLLFLELAGKDEDHDELARKIGLLKGVKCQLVKLEMDEELFKERRHIYPLRNFRC